MPGCGWRWQLLFFDPVPLGRDRGALQTLGLWLLVTSHRGRYWPARSCANLHAAGPALYGARPADAVHGGASSRYIGKRLSPSTLFGEVVVALLDPTTRALGPIYPESSFKGAVLGAPLPLGASVLIAWPQIVGMIATAIMLFVIGYVIFQRQEVRA